MRNPGCVLEEMGELALAEGIWGMRMGNGAGTGKS